MPIPAGGGSPALSGNQDVQAWVDRTRSHLMSGRNEERNTLAAPYTAGSGVLSFAGSLGGIVANVRIGIGLNTFYVRSVTQAGLTASVIGGQDGTTDVDAASGDLVRVGPRFTDADIMAALQAEVSDLSAPDNGLWRTVTEDFAYTTSTRAYPFVSATGATLIDVYEVRIRTSTAADPTWFLVPKVAWRVDRTGSVAGAPTIQLAYPPCSGDLMRVVYRATFADFTAMADLQAATGLPATAWDIPPLGAAMRLMVPREVKRNFTENQGDTRRAVEVEAGNIAQSMRPIAALRQQRIQAEAARLTAMYPDRRF